MLEGSHDIAKMGFALDSAAEHAEIPGGGFEGPGAEGRYRRHPHLGDPRAVHDGYRDAGGDIVYHLYASGLR